MDQVTRIGVSLEPELLKQFDEMISKKGYVSRSEALRDLVRDSLAENEWKNGDMEMTGIIIVIYDISVNNIFERLESVHTRWRDMIQFTNSIDLDSRNRIDMITAKGKLSDLKSMSSDMMSIKGVRRGKLTMAAPNTGNLHYVGLRN